MIGWGNLAVEGGSMRSDTGYVTGAAPRSRGFRLALETELDRIRTFLRL